MNPPCRIVVAAMPWNLPDITSIQVAQLKSYLAAQGIPVFGRHYYRDIGAYVGERCADTITRMLVGEEVFGMLLFPQNAAALARRISDRVGDGVDPVECAAGAARLVDDAVMDLLRLQPDLVGLTTTHTQYLASVCLARRLKAAAPHVKVVLGGLALYGRPALETLRLFPEIDYVVVGEGEVPLWQLARHLSGEIPLQGVPQLVHRRDGAIVQNPETAAPPSLDELPPPDHTDYFTHSLSPEHYADGHTVRLSIESVRGCKWGRCSFCVEGLPTRTGFRAKSPAHFRREVIHGVQAHHILDFVLTDPNVAYSGAAFAQAAALPYDLRFMVELSGLVDTATFHTLVAAGMRVAQIGIESFSPSLLKKFNKGVTLSQYVFLLKLCRENEVQLVYNNIYGSPFETQAEIDEAVENMERLMFFQPPRTSVFRVSTGSAVMDDPAAYNIAHIVPPPELEAYPPEVAGAVGPLISLNAGMSFIPHHPPHIDYRRFFAALDRWWTIHKLGARLLAHVGDGLVRVEHRIGEERRIFDFTDPVETAILRFCAAAVRSRREIAAALPQFAATRIDSAIHSLWERLVLFVDGERCLSLPSFSSRGLREAVTAPPPADS